LVGGGWGWGVLLDELNGLFLHFQENTYFAINVTVRHSLGDFQHHLPEGSGMAGTAFGICI